MEVGLEIEVDLSKLQLDWWLPIILIALAFFAVVGRAVTPADGRVLTPDEWQAVQAERLYQEERAQLREYGQELAEFLNAQDPVRVQLQVQRMVNQVSKMTSPALVAQRQAFLDAANAVVAYQQGQTSRDEAVAAVQEFLNAVK